MTSIKKDIFTLIAKLTITKSTVLKLVLGAILSFIVGICAAYKSGETVGGAALAWASISDFMGAVFVFMILVLVVAWVFNLRFKNKE